MARRGARARTSTFQARYSVAVGRRIRAIVAGARGFCLGQLADVFDPLVQWLRHRSGPPFHASPRRGRGGREDGDAEGGVRFIIDLELDRLGRLQFDGLVQGKDKRFYLILRSAGDLPQQISHDIRQIFEDACEVTGIKGEIVFQSGPSEFVEITPEAMAENIRGLVV